MEVVHRGATGRPSACKQDTVVFCLQGEGKEVDGGGERAREGKALISLAIARENPNNVNGEAA